MVELSGDKMQAFKAKLWGDVLLPSEGEGAAFKEACHTWTLLRTNKVPALVVRARGAADISEAVKFAAEEGLEVGVKAGGHSAPQSGLVDGGLVIDLSLMRSCVVDPYKKTAIVGGGCLLGDVDRECAMHQLMVPLGHAPVTGMGLVLGGGIGIATRIFGVTCSHILGATLVLSDGSVVVCDEEHDPELLWALKGAGAAMGVVTSMTLKLNDIPTDKTYTGLMLWPDDPEHKTFRTIAKWMTETAFSEPGFSCNLIRAYDPHGNSLLGSMMVHVSDKSREEKEAFLAPLRALGPIEDLVGKMRYVDTQFSLLEMIRAMPPHFDYWTSGQVKRDNVTDQLLDAYVGCMESLPFKDYPCTLCLFDMWGGAHGKATGPNPFAQTDGEIGWMIAIGWVDPALDAAALDKAKQIKSTMGAFGCHSVYVNMTSGSTNSEDAQIAARVGGAANLTRLRAVKRRVDPLNMFKSHSLHGL